MADSVPKLRRLLNEARERIRQLESMPKPEPVVEIREVVREVPGPERVVYRDVPVEVVKTEIKEVEKPVPFIEKVAVYPETVRRVEVEKVVYVDNPEHIMTIKILQDRLCQYTSASDL